MAQNKKKGKTRRGRVAEARDNARQMAHPAEFRIKAPAGNDDVAGIIRDYTKAADRAAQAAERDAQSPVGAGVAHDVVAELATCLWYLKTKHFRLAWDGAAESDDDPKVRRALSRLNRGWAALHSMGVEVRDYKGSRFASGGESYMKPIDFVPVAGLTMERVSETVQPAVFLQNRLIQRSEVFVEVPEAPVAASSSQSPAEMTSADPISENQDSGEDINGAATAEGDSHE